MTTNTPMAYVATKECGCIVAAVLKGAVAPKVLGEIAQKWLAAGYNWEYVGFDYVLTNWGLCDHGAKQPLLPLNGSTPKTEDSESTPQGIEYAVNPDGTTAVSPAYRAMRILQAVQDGKTYAVDAPLQPENGGHVYHCAYATRREEGGYVYSIDEITVLQPDHAAEVTDRITFDNQHVRFTTAMGDIASLFQWDIEEPEASEEQPDLDDDQYDEDDDQILDHINADNF